MMRRRRRSGAPQSEAVKFAKGKQNVLSWAFDDPAGDMGSVYINDQVTPANFFKSSVASEILAKFTGWSATSPMTVRGRDGTLKYAPHNLFLNSDAPATQSITTVVGLKYKVILTGSGSITLSGAGSGTVTDGSPVEITASTTSLTCTVSGSPTTAQVVNSPCHEGYVSAAGSAKFSIPTTYDTSGNKLGFLDWEARTNAAWWSRDLTQSAHVKTNATAYLTAKGTDGIAGSASRLAITAANGNVIQSITATSAQRVSSAKVRRAKGSGTVKMSQGETTGSNLAPANLSGWTVGGGSVVTDTWSGMAQYTVLTMPTTITVGKPYKITSTNTIGSGVFNWVAAGVGTVYRQLAGGTQEVYFVATSNQLLLIASNVGSVTVASCDVRECTSTTLSLTTPTYEEVTGTELCDNGGFDDGSGWTLGSGHTISGGALNISTAGYTETYRSASVVTGKLYRVTFDVLSTNNNVSIGLAGSNAETVNGTGSKTVYIVAGSSTAQITIASGTVTTVLDNFSVKEVSPTQAWTEAETASATITNPCVAIWSNTAGDALDIDHCQCEIGAKASPPIITAGAAVTRALSILKILSGTFPASVSDFYAVAEAIPGENNAAAGILCFDANGRMIELPNLVPRIFDGTNLVASSFTATVGQRFKAASTGSGVTARISANGGTSVSGTYDGTINSGDLYVGSRNVASPINGIVRRVLYAPIVGTAADIEADSVLT